MSESSEELKRIADALEEVLRLVKEDQERTRKYMEEEKDEQKKRISKYNSASSPLALARGQRLQKGSLKLQAASGKLDKTIL